ncbi:MAG: phosphoethanolamine--lipid A transferase [Neisseria sp.]|nr:phosphoethanolamine--lipid A transferase [Neisseria sp.]
MMFKLRAPWAVLWLCLYFLCVFNVGYWREVLQDKPLNLDNFIFLLVMFVAFWAAMFVIINLFLIPYLHKLFIPLIFVAGSAAAYATMSMGAYFNVDMLHNVLQTHAGEAKALLSWQYLLWVGVTGVLPALLYVKFFRLRYCEKWYREVMLRSGSLILGLLVFGGLAYGFYNDFAPFFRNNKPIVHKLNPTNFLGSGIKMASVALKSKPVFTPIGMDAQQLPTADGKRKPRVLVLVIGETTRAQNWGLNGYARQTTPELAQRADVINFKDVSACGTSTAISVPCMFSGMRRDGFNEEEAYYRSNVMDILQQAGIGTWWRENDGGCKGVCARIENEDIRQQVNPQWCTFEGCFDMGLLENLPQRLAEIKQDTVIVLHTMGSHGPTYYQRYPTEYRRFTPTCDTNQIQDCSREELVNTYDNGIAYIDHMLSSTIDLLQQNQNIDAAMWYLSDHGESLGERGLYLHAAPYAIAPPEQTQVPMVFWASDHFARSAQLNTGCLKAKAENERFSHDNLFASLLGLFDVQTTVYRPEADVFKSCRIRG